MMPLRKGRGSIPDGVMVRDLEGESVLLNLRWPLPRRLFFLYFPLRIFRLVAKYGSRLANRRRLF